MSDDGAERTLVSQSEIDRQLFPYSKEITLKRVSGTIIKTVPIVGRLQCLFAC